MLGGTCSRACGGDLLGFHETIRIYIEGKNTRTISKMLQLTVRKEKTVVPQHECRSAVPGVVVVWRGWCRWSDNLFSPRQQWNEFIQKPIIILEI